MNTMDPITGASLGYILLVDDEPDHAATCGDLLKYLGYLVRVEGDGSSALRWFRSNQDRVDLVILDRKLPGIGGAALFRAIRVMNTEVPVIMHSGTLDDEQCTRLKAEGIDAILHKPINVRRLARTVQEVIEGRQAG